MLAAQSPAFGHSGGLDSHGCHAGSQPYHCHGGGSGGGGGGGGGGDDDDDDDSGGGSSAYVPPPPTAEEIAAANAAAERRRELSAAQSELYQAKAKESQSKNELADLERRHTEAAEELERQRKPHQTLVDRVDRYHQLAKERRNDRIELREAAATKFAALKDRNRDARREYRDQRVAGPFVAAFFGGFLLFPLIRWLARLLFPWRFIWLISGLIASPILFLVGGSLRSPLVGGIVSAIAGLLLSVVFMLPGMWWFRLRIPSPLKVVFLAFSVFMLGASVAGLAMLTAPVAQQAPATTAALVAEASADPAAQEVEEANKADEAADKLQPKVDELAEPLAEAEKQEQELSKLLDAAQSQLTTDSQAVADAQTKLDGVL